MNETLERRPLSHVELIARTGKKRFSAQCRELDYQGVPYTRRRDGSPVVYMSGDKVVDRKEPELHL